MYYSLLLMKFRKGIGTAVDLLSLLIRALRTTAKLEVSKEEKLNPIRQDTKKGHLRYIKYGPYPWNYGMVPQTYESPTERIPSLDLVGTLNFLFACSSSSCLPILSTSCSVYALLFHVCVSVCV